MDREEDQVVDREEDQVVDREEDQGADQEEDQGADQGAEALTVTSIARPTMRSGARVTAACRATAVRGLAK